MTTKKNKKFSSSSLNRRLGKLTVGEFLRTWRQTEEMTLREFGSKVGLSVANLCDIEKGRKGVSPLKAESIARSLGVPPELLVRLSIEEILNSSGMKYLVEIRPAS